MGGVGWAGGRQTLAWCVFVGVALSMLIGACSRPARPTAPQLSAVGTASWYGPGFNGRRTANGEIYNQEDLTAASRSLPLGTLVMVTNLDNGRAVEVRINDRGPFAKGREIDLSHRAARVLGILNPGTVRVRIDVISMAPGVRPDMAGGYFVQVGAFSRAANAERLRQRLAASYSDVRVDELDAGKRRYYRVRMGSFATAQQARARALKWARLGLPIVVVKE